MILSSPPLSASTWSPCPLPPGGPKELGRLSKWVSKPAKYLGVKMLQSLMSSKRAEKLSTRWAKR